MATARLVGGGGGGGGGVCVCVGGGLTLTSLINVHGRLLFLMRYFLPL